MSKLNVCLRHISEVFLYEYYCLGDDEYEISEEDTLTLYKTKAKELLLSTSRKSNEIGAMVGYKDPHYFSYLFKKTTGMTTTQYRGKGRAEDEE